jgi:hypothetical protein
VAKSARFEFMEQQERLLGKQDSSRDTSNYVLRVANNA